MSTTMRTKTLYNSSHKLWQMQWQHTAHGSKLGRSTKESHVLPFSNYTCTDHSQLFKIISAMPYQCYFYRVFFSFSIAWLKDWILMLAQLRNKIPKMTLQPISRRDRNRNAWLWATWLFSGDNLHSPICFFGLLFVRRNEPSSEFQCQPIHQISTTDFVDRWDCVFTWVWWPNLRAVTM